MRRDINELLSKFLRALDEPRGYRIDAKLLLKNLDPEELSELVSMGILEPVLRIKEGELLEPRFKVSRIDKEKGIVQLIDIHNPGPPQNKPLYEYMDYDVKIEPLMSTVLELIAKKLRFELYLKGIKYRMLSDYVKCNASINGRETLFFFQFKKMHIPEFLIELARSVELKKPVVLVLSSKSVINLMDFIELVAVGALAYIMTFEDLARIVEGDREVISDFEKWLSYVFDVLELEDMVLSSLEDEKFKDLRNLLVKVDTNPKYLVTMLSLFKVAQKIKGKDSWKLFEDLVGTALSFLYGGEISQLGYKASFENVPDSIFVVRRSKHKPGQSEIELIGIVDAKSGDLELSPHDVPKYEKYFDLIREYPWVSSSSSSQLVILYFVTLNSCEEVKRKYSRSSEDKGLRGFYYRMQNLLQNNEYIAILPVESLLMLIDTYMSILRRMKLQRTWSGIHGFYRAVLRPDNKQVITSIADRFYCIDSQRLRNFVKSKFGEDILDELLRRKGSC
jgi:hypothetical protein